LGIEAPKMIFKWLFFRPLYEKKFPIHKAEREKRLYLYPPRHITERERGKDLLGINRIWIKILQYQKYYTLHTFKTTSHS